MKVVKHDELVTYKPGGHYDCRARRVHNKEISGTEMLTVGLSWFLPEGGAEHNVTNEGMELVYYVVEGELTVKSNDETFHLCAGDSIYFKAGDTREVINESDRPVAMLVISARKPQE